MKLQVLGRIRPMYRGEGVALHRENDTKIAARAGGPFFGFLELHSEKSTTYDVFKTSVLSLVDVFVNGCNTGLLIAGETGSGKSFTMAGEGDFKAGLVPLIFDQLFSILAKENYRADVESKRIQSRVSLQMFEVYNEVIRDLLILPIGSRPTVDIQENAIQGVHLQNITELSLNDSTQAKAQFIQGWGRRTELSSDSGLASHNSAIFCQVLLERIYGNGKHPIKSRFTIVELPGLENLGEDTGYSALWQGSQANKSLITLSQVVSSLAGNPSPDRVINYNNSKLTRLLQEELGGNCNTRALVCLKPFSKPDTVGLIVQFCQKLSQVTTFPIVNDSSAQSLLTQERAKLLILRQQTSLGSVMSSVPPYGPDMVSDIRRLQTENLVLKDQNERLQLRLDQLSNKFGHVASTKTDLSQQLLLSEEEKLKVSQSLVEMQIENNKIKEETEATNFELTNKIIMLENQLLEAQNASDRHKRAAKAAKEQLKELETDRKDLADEYVVLKTNYLALTNEHKRECSRNENLAIELLNLVNSKAALMRQVLILTNADPAHADDPNAEIARIRAIIHQNSSGKIKADEILGTQRDREVIEDRLFASQRKFESEINRLKVDYGDEHKKYENRMNALMKELADTRVLARERQHKISELNAKLITLRGEKEAVETQTNRLQHKVKDLGEDFRARLVKYVEDIAEYVDKGSGVPGQQHEKKMRDYVDNMLKDIRRSHREREDQLSQAAQTFKKRLQNTVHSYEQVLIAYRNLRQTCEARGFDRADLGPDEYELKLGDTEIQSSHLKELDKAKTELNRAKNELDAVKLRYGLFGDDKKENLGDLNSISARSDLWAALRKQLREFTLNTQQQLEQERARLLSENQVLSQQLKESQEYIDSHLVRYKQEILRLRKMLGMSETEASILTDRLAKIRKK
ncbi:coiled-coil domain-containing protein 78-like [Biomphalaria glabrata]|uniref:Coiled-coil domain-containing protein 78-like n=1 Tax=Biomphalaria glabrata TaxID=6526 RepID=A0A9W3AGQ4_BIOGL|nr:coiled-coil domain-containing protein 78-like [Biomphalaria glabrata]XP_055886475.1 coiled-coil domain-containing protein 78-like [Biomphalaria glabrata]XP_055886476.1 coiled-coil domain-containing protein 78-like [Biomphalaria glabrata]